MRLWGAAAPKLTGFQPTRQRQPPNPRPRGRPRTQLRPPRTGLAASRRMSTGPQAHQPRQPSGATAVETLRRDHAAHGSPNERSAVAAVIAQRQQRDQPS